MIHWENDSIIKWAECKKCRTKKTVKIETICTDHDFTFKNDACAECGHVTSFKNIIQQL